jgi:hypothetical protein
MVKATVRDRIWNATIDLAVNGLDTPPGENTEIEEAGEWYKQSYDGVGFTKKELFDRVEAGERTVHDVLKTMVEMGLLGESERRLRRLKTNKHDLIKTERVYNTVYYPAGDIATEEVEESELIGGSVSTDGEPSEDVINDAFDEADLG